MLVPPHIQNLLFDGNHLSLDFINTIHNRFVSEPKDYLRDKGSWVGWLARKELVDITKPEGDTSFDLEKIRATRELLYHLFIGIIQKKAISQGEQRAFNGLLLKLRKATVFEVENHKPIESVQTHANNLNSYLLPIVSQAHELLISDNIHRVKECGNCGWLFLDTSKAGRRKWCNMKVCGNEVKARRHYRKIKDQQQAP